jgi:hypothetical protein
MLHSLQNLGYCRFLYFVLNLEVKETRRLYVLFKFQYIKMFHQSEFVKLVSSVLTRLLHSCVTSRRTTTIIIIIIIITIIIQLAWYLQKGGLNRVRTNTRMRTFALHKQRSPTHQSRYRNARNSSTDCNRIFVCTTWWFNIHIKCTCITRNEFG